MHVCMHVRKCGVGGATSFPSQLLHVSGLRLPDLRNDSCLGHAGVLEFNILGARDQVEGGPQAINCPEEVLLRGEGDLGEGEEWWRLSEMLFGPASLLRLFPFHVPIACSPYSTHLIVCQVRIDEVLGSLVHGLVASS